MNLTSGNQRTLVNRYIAGLEVHISLPNYMAFQRSFNSATKVGLGYSGISFARDTGEKVSFVIPEEELPDHLVAYTLSVRKFSEGPRVFLHLFYRMTKGHF